MPLDPIQVEIPDDAYWRRQIKCQDACPVGTDARGYVRAIADGDFEAAYLIARGPNPLASICGRVCGAPCEAACRRGAVDDAVSIRALKRFVTEQFGVESFDKPTFAPLALLKRVLGDKDRRQCRSGEEISSYQALLDGLESPKTDGPKVAIIGSGPAGLAAAHDLALLGARPTVYEMEAVPAGMLAVGIPEYRLPRDLIEAEVELIRSLGVKFVCNTCVGKDMTLKELRRDHQATIIAIGAKRSREIELPGSQGPGVMGGVEFLRDVAVKDRSSDSTLSQLGKRIVVIGGGNVAYDVSRSLIRQIGYDVSRSALRQAEVREVHLCCLEGVEDMPADDVEILEGHEEGVELHAALAPVSIQRDEGGAVCGMTFKRCLSVFDDQGRFSPIFDEDDITTIEVDTVVWAIGQKTDASLIEADSGIEVDPMGRIKNDAESLQTTAMDVFVTGDIAYGTRLLIDAVASGKKCARSVWSQLNGQSLQPEQELVQINLPDYSRERDYEKIPRMAVSTASAKDRVARQDAVVEQGFNQEEAMTEASRCFDCGVNTIFDSDKCILCGGCADVCPELCLQLVSCDRLAGNDQMGELLRLRYDQAELADMSAIIKDEEKCIRCALCAQRCPVGAITMERVGFSSQWVGATS